MHLLELKRPGLAGGLSQHLQMLQDVSPDPVANTTFLILSVTQWHARVGTARLLPRHNLFFRLSRPPEVVNPEALLPALPQNAHDLPR